MVSLDALTGCRQGRLRTIGGTPRSRFGYCACRRMGWAVLREWIPVFLMSLAAPDWLAACPTSVGRRAASMIRGR